MKTKPQDAAPRIGLVGVLPMSILAVVVLAGVVVIAAGILLATAAPALALANNGGGPDSTVTDLKKKGYTCGRIGIGGYECTKPGEPTYYCDNTEKCSTAGNTAKPTKPTNPTWRPTVVSPSPTFVASR